MRRKKAMSKRTKKAQKRYQTWAFSADTMQKLNPMSILKQIAKKECLDEKHFGWMGNILIYDEKDTFALIKGSEISIKCESEVPEELECMEHECMEPEHMEPEAAWETEENNELVS